MNLNNWSRYPIWCNRWAGVATSSSAITRFSMNHNDRCEPKLSLSALHRSSNTVSRCHLKASMRLGHLEVHHFHAQHSNAPYSSKLQIRPKQKLLRSTISSHHVMHHPHSCQEVVKLPWVTLQQQLEHASLNLWYRWHIFQNFTNICHTNYAHEYLYSDHSRASGCWNLLQPDVWFPQRIGWSHMFESPRPSALPCCFCTWRICIQTQCHFTTVFRFSIHSPDISKMCDIWIASPAAAVPASSSASQDERAMLACVRHALKIRFPQRKTINDALLLRVTLHSTYLTHCKLPTQNLDLDLFKLSLSIWQNWDKWSIRTSTGPHLCNITP